MYTLEFTLNSDFSFTADLRDTSSQRYKEYSQIVVIALTSIFSGVSGIVEITVTEFFEGSVIARSFEISCIVGMLIRGLRILIVATQKWMLYIFVTQGLCEHET